MDKKSLVIGVLATLLFLGGIYTMATDVTRVNQQVEITKDSFPHGIENGEQLCFDFNITLNGISKQPLSELFSQKEIEDMRMGDPTQFGLERTMHDIEMFNLKRKAGYQPLLGGFCFDGTGMTVEEKQNRVESEYAKKLNIMQDRLEELDAVPAVEIIPLDSLENYEFDNITGKWTKP